MHLMIEYDFDVLISDIFLYINDIYTCSKTLKQIKLITI